jgi:general secretion pathway protein E
LEHVSAVTLWDLVSRLQDLGEVAQDGASSAEVGDLCALSCRELRERTRLRPQGFADLLSEVYGLPRSDPRMLRGGGAVTSAFSQHFLRERSFYPYRDGTGLLRLALADPSQTEAMHAIAITLGEGPLCEVASFEDIAHALDQVAGAPEAPTGENTQDALETDNAETLRDLASGAPVVRALDFLFERAAALRASDIHIEPQRREASVRMRIDGVLRPIPLGRNVPARALVSRLKILAGLNIAEQRLPQDGRMQVTDAARSFDVRVATMPTARGEAAILRLLERGTRLVTFDELGLNARDAKVLRARLAAPNGMVIVTGPTGSGKTTTLAANLALLNDSTRKILTIEDPIEYEIDGVQQSQVRPAVGMTFAAALRAFLRQDPDVIMVGEIRDAEPARIAVQAALTGHLVLTTLHTNTAAAAITRLADIGVERYLIASTLTAVVGQRLVRRLCEDCRRSVLLSPESCAANPRFSAMGLTVGTRLCEPVGCDSCGFTGYRGRQAIFEVLDVDEEVRRLVLAGADDAAIESAGKRHGMTTFVEDGRRRCLAGVTSVDEVFRVAALR